MTTPAERTLALKWCHELLVDIRDGAGATAEDRATAAEALVHYPNASEHARWIENGVTSIPTEAVLAMEGAGDLLRNMWLRDDLEQVLRRRTQYVLRHYPGTGQIQRWAKRLQRQPIGQWLQIGEGCSDLPASMQTAPADEP